MKIGKTRLRMSDGSVRNFSSQRARDHFERVAEALKHGWLMPRTTKQGKKK